MIANRKQLIALCACAGPGRDALNQRPQEGARQVEAHRLGGTGTVINNNNNNNKIYNT